jgi:hypothetical protein
VLGVHNSTRARLVSPARVIRRRRRIDPCAAIGYICMLSGNVRRAEQGL